MAARAIWKGIIQFQKIAVSVKFFSAIEDRKVHFRLLHQKDHTPVVQKMVNPATGDPVPFEEIRRGYETDQGDIILLEEEDLQSLEPESSRIIEIIRFVDPDRIDHQWYDRPYHLVPDTNAESYFAFARALENREVEGVARWSMRKKNYIGALHGAKGFLQMITLRHSKEVIAASELPRPEGRAMEKQELKMAEQLLRALEDSFDPAAYKDEYRQRVLELVEIKARGGKMRFEKPAKRETKVISLQNLLKQSVRRAKEERKIA